MHGNTNDRRALEREALRNVINQWNANRLDLFELSEPNEDLEFHGVMRFYFQDSGQKVATKCIRVASDATVEDVISTLVEKFRPDMRMLSVPSYALFELHEGCAERKMADDEKPLLVQLNWHVDDREGRFLLKNVDDKTVHSMGSMDSNASFRRKLSKREKKQLKKQEKLSRMKSDNGDINDDGVAEKLYTELPETSFTRSISNPEAVMRRRRQQKLEKKLQQFRSKDGGPDTGGTLKIYGEALCKDVPYKTLLLSIRDCAGAVVREMLDKYGLSRTDPSQWCLVQVTQQPGAADVEYVLDDDECPLSILMTSQNSGSIMFHVRRRPAECAPRKRKKKPAGGALGQATPGGARDARAADAVPVLVELAPDGTTPHDAATRTIRLTSDVTEVGSANGIALQLYGPHIQPRHCVISTGAAADGAATLTPCHADAHTYVDGRRVHQATPLRHGAVVQFGRQHGDAYRFLEPAHERRGGGGRLAEEGGTPRAYESRSPRALSPSDPSRDNVETTFDLDGNVETVSTASGAREDSRSLGSASENRLSGLDRYPRGQDPILPAVLEFPEEPQEQFLARVVTHLDVATPTFRLAPAYALYLCARYRASTHYRPELTPTERAHKLTGLLQHAAMLIRHTIQDRSTESNAQAFWLANASELLHFLKSDRHVGAFSLQAQDVLADAVQLAFRHLVAGLVSELEAAAPLTTPSGDDHPRDLVNVLGGAMNLLRRCRVNAALTIQLFSQLFHWLSAKALSTIINNGGLCTRAFGHKLANRLRGLQAWAESQGLELAAECHLAKVVQCAHLLQAPKGLPEDLASLSAACFKLNSLQLGALLMQYKPEPGEPLAAPSLLEQAARAAEGVADELARAEGREVALHDEPAPPMRLLLPDDGFSCDVVHGVPPGLADFLHPLQAAGLCRLAAQPTSSGHWTVYMSAARPASALGGGQPEVQSIRLHKAGGGMGLSIVAAKGAGQERLGIYVKSVVAGGAADRDGRLAAGDQLLSVDGHSLLGITQERAAEFLQRTGAVVALDVAKAGAVYHGLASLLQQPSPQPHRATDKHSYYSDYETPRESTESLYSPKSYRLFTPPAVKPKNNVFFCSDDSLFKSERRKFTIPRIEIESDEPVFNLQVTDFSEPSPKNVTLTYDETGTSMRHSKVEEFCAKPSARTLKDNFAQRKSYSIEGPASDRRIDDITELDKFLSIGLRKFGRQLPASASMQDLSSSNSSINSGVHESDLDLSRDTAARRKNWRSPYEIRHRDVKDLAERFEDKATSVPVLSKKKYAASRSKSVSEERLDDRLTEYERLEIFKLLHDWSLDGSESKSEFNMKLCGENVPNGRGRVKFGSEPDLSPKARQSGLVATTKFFSDNSLNGKTNLDQFFHECEFRNCIFNVGTKETDKPKSILKQTKDEVECLSNITNLQDKPKNGRRHSEITPVKLFNSELVRCDSLERLNDLKQPHKKFPDSYIVTRRSSASKTERKAVSNNNNDENVRSPKRMALRKKGLPKTWKSCSDIKRRQSVVRKCCRNAQKTCPVLKDCAGRPDGARKTQSCASIDRDNVRLDGAARLGPRRMSERDLPSKVDSERSIPSSKSVPALHQIHSPTAADHAPRPPLHHLHHHHHHQQQQQDGYNNNSRTSSSNSINNNGAAMANGGYGAANPGLRSRSTHNLHQQDGGFYQNLSIYRNQVPSPQHLGDRTSALRSSQNSLHSPAATAANAQRPSSAYYAQPPPAGAGAARPHHLHQSIPNLRSPPVAATVAARPPDLDGRRAAGGYPEGGGPMPPLHVHARQEERGVHEGRYNGGGLLREDVFRQSQGSRHDEIVRYPSQGNIRLAETQQNHPNGGGEIRPSRSEDALRHHAHHPPSDMTRYASSGNVRGEQQQPPTHRAGGDDRHLRGAAKLAEMSEEVRRRQSRGPPYGQPQQQQQQQYYAMAQNAQSMQNLSIGGGAQYGQPPQQQGVYQQHQSHVSPTYKGAPGVQKATRKDDPLPIPDLPPTTTHPLYSASSQDPPRVALYASAGGQLSQQQQAVGGKPPARDPWAREERERQQEARREAARQWQEGQLRELAALPYRTAQQEEQLRALRLEREFQRRAQEAAEEMDDDTEKESSSSPQISPTQTASHQNASTATPAPTSAGKPLDVPPPLHLPPPSILKPNSAANGGGQPSPPESSNGVAVAGTAAVPPPPERGSSFAVMSMRAKDTTKRVSFNDASAAGVGTVAQPPTTLPIEESVREDPNSFLRQAESMLASPTSPTDASSPGGMGVGASAVATPGVIGAQEVYRDPRTRRLAEQAMRRDDRVAAVPEKLSFKEKMKMFAMETGERETPKDKSKISRAQRDIDNLGSPASMVH